MPDPRSRRSFLTGVLACGTLTAAATYVLPGGRSLPAVELNLVTGPDSSGVRPLLVDMWNRANPNTRVRVTTTADTTTDQKLQMLTEARNGTADIVNLDTIDIPEFARQDLIVPIELPDDQLFVGRTIDASRVDNQPGHYWAAPFHTDVGMLFERLAPDGPRTEATSLAEVLDTRVAPRSQGFIGQLRPSSSASYEAFVVNVLEHAISRDNDILDGSGIPAYDLVRWQKALNPLRDAVADRRVTLADNEQASRELFTANPDRRFMRNWPVHYRVMQQHSDADVRADRIRVYPLPVGILGGRSLAVVSRSAHRGRAAELIRFLTGEEAQKVTAAYGLPPTRITAYADPNLKAFIPHLEAIRGAVETARPRPTHWNYPAFAAAVVKHVLPMVRDGRDLPSAFVDEIRAALA
ncbi:extracellular solute-binding protein [Luedemannella helvata]|uniref:ABC transporter substrate-binding protein n=1 Tax=Luedemannella helvata TaxID=349315 RepID=A0ABN2JXB2_9ACTN